MLGLIHNGIATTQMTQTQVDLIVGAIWLVCVIVCILKWKFWTVILAIGASVAIAVGPLITGNYLFNLLSPIELGPFVCAIRLAKPVSWWAKWFYWGPLDNNRQLLRPSPKLPRALARFPEQTVDFEKPESPSK
jgi:hypothetical protein